MHAGCFGFIVPGIKTASFSMYGASYLAGRLAADQTKTGQIAVIAGRKAQVYCIFIAVLASIGVDSLILAVITAAVLLIQYFRELIQKKKDFPPLSRFQDLPMSEQSVRRCMYRLILVVKT